MTKIIAPALAAVLLTVSLPGRLPAQDEQPLRVEGAVAVIEETPQKTRDRDVVILDENGYAYVRKGKPSEGGLPREGRAFTHELTVRIVRQKIKILDRRAFIKRQMEKARECVDWDKYWVKEVKAQAEATPDEFEREAIYIPLKPADGQHILRTKSDINKEFYTEELQAREGAGAAAVAYAEIVK